jgi:hypothetical protein
MKTKLLFTTMLIASFCLNAQEIQKRTITAFNKIDLSGATEVVYAHSDTFKLEVKANAKHFDKIITNVENGTLYIFTKVTFYSNSRIVVNVSGNNLNAIKISGASSLKSSTPLKNDSLSITISGASDANLVLENDYTKINQSGASNLNLSGTTNNLITQVSGASILKSYNLTSKQANIIATGASTAKIYVTDKLIANASGASSVKAKGNVNDIVANASTSSSIIKVLNDDTKKEINSFKVQNNDTIKNAYDNNLQDTITFILNKKRFIIIDVMDTTKKQDVNEDADDFKHWRGFSIGVNGYLSPSGSLSLDKKNNFMELNYSRSYNFQLNLFEHQFNIYKNYVKINTGFGFDFHSYSFNNKTILNADTSFTWGTIDSSNKYSYRKNKLRCTYLQVPLLLEFNTSNNPEKTFHIGFGVVGQYLISSRTKQKLEENNNRFTKTRKDNYNLNPLGAKALVYLGYKKLTVLAEYNLTSLFKTNQGVQLYPFALSVRLIPF